MKLVVDDVTRSGVDRSRSARTARIEITFRLTPAGQIWSRSARTARIEIWSAVVWMLGSVRVAVRKDRED